MTTDQITGIYAYGVTLSSDTFSSPVTVTGTASVVGQTTGIYAATDWTVVNQGSITTNGTFTGVAVMLQDGGAVTNDSGGYIFGLGTGIRIAGAPGTVDNAGSISAPNRYGVELDSGTVDNRATGVIAGYRAAISIDAGLGTIDNSGTLEATAPGGRGVLMFPGGTVTNEVGGLISGGGGGLQIGGGAPAQTSLVDNAGTITGGSNAGVRIAGNGTLTNEISGVISGDRGVEFYGSGFIENDGNITGVEVGMAVNSSDMTIVNRGTIAGYEGLTLAGSNSSVTNAAGGSISGISTQGDEWTIDNAGTIGSATSQSPGGTVATYGVSLGSDRSVLINESNGYISGGIDGVVSTGNNSTIENAGTISGGTDAVCLDGSINNRLIVDAGAVFDGTVVAATIVSGATPANVLELSANTGAGTISGIGTDYVGFQTVTIDAGATWTIGDITTATDVVNAGTIGSAADGSTGLSLDEGGAVTNQIAGVISSANIGLQIGAYEAYFDGTVDNAGQITGSTVGIGGVLQGYGINVYGNLLLTNEATGTITGGYWAVSLGGVETHNTIDNAA